MNHIQRHWIPRQEPRGTTTRLFTILLIISVFSIPANAEPARITSAILKTENSQTELILTLNRQPQYQLFTLTGPHRAVIDLETTLLQTKLPAPKNTELPAITRLRSGKRPDQSLRLVVDLKSPIKTSSRLQKQGSHWQLIIALGSQQATQARLPTKKSKQERQKEIQEELKKELEKTIPAAHLTTNDNEHHKPQKAQSKSKKIPEGSQTTQELKPDIKPGNAMRLDPRLRGDGKGRGDDKVHKNDKPRRDIVIVIDAGHGGKDPGAVSTNGIREKDITLAIAKRLHRLLQQESGIRTILTRASDTHVGLQQRLKTAQKYKADVFVSLHADAFKTAKVSGASVFTLSPSSGSANSQPARELAAGEMQADDHGTPLQSVLLDLSQTAALSLSTQLGSQVLTQLGQVTRLRQSSVEQARFAVLKAPDIPSILIELGFMSNAEEAKQLHNPVHQTRVALALKTGLMNHFTESPRPGTAPSFERKHETHSITTASTR